MPNNRPGIRRPRRPAIGAPPGTLTVDADARPTSVHVLAYGPEGFDERDFTDPAELKAYLADWAVAWVNVDGLGNGEMLREIGAAFDLHPLALEDVTHVPQRPKAEIYGQTLFLIAHMVTATPHLETEQLSLFVTDGVVVTFQERHGDCLDPVRERIRQGVGRVRGAGADYLAYALLDTVLDHYFPVLETYGETMAALEDAVLESADVPIVSRIRRIKRDLLALRRIAWPQRDAVAVLLRGETPQIAPDTVPYLRDCADHVTRVIDVLETHRELASDLMSIHMSVVSNQMNAVMKTLTVMAAIFIPLTFLAGIYGMNFEKMPELKWPWGYPAVLGIMLAVAAGMLLYFRRKRWL